MLDVKIHAQISEEYTASNFYEPSFSYYKVSKVVVALYLEHKTL